MSFSIIRHSDLAWMKLGNVFGIDALGDRLLDYYDMAIADANFFRKLNEDIISIKIV